MALSKTALRQHDSALADLKEVQFVKSDDVHSFMINDALGIVNHKLGLEDDAEENFKDAISESIELGQTSKRPEFYQHLAQLYCDQNRFDEAAKELKLAIESAPNVPIYYYKLGLAYF